MAIVHPKIFKRMTEIETAARAVAKNQEMILGSGGFERAEVKQEAHRLLTELSEALDELTRERERYSETLRDG